MLALGGWLVFEGRVTVGTLVAFFAYLTQLVSPARQMAGVLVVAQQARAGAERVLELLDSLPDVTEKPDAAALSSIEGAIAFNDVSFGYLRSEPVLDGFDLQVSAGETVALVGTSGSGKSTVGLLLPRFYDVQQGTVTIDGIDVRDVTFDSLRRQIGVVFEDAFLFSDTVRANIAYGRPDATDAEVEAAARAAEAHSFVMELPDGYDTIVGERGLLLSGGQRQRITLARALITDPRVLLLDDATSSIDSRIEEEIHATLRRLMVGRTTILVAHRRSTLHLADRIVVLQRGRVVDSGTHDELFGRCLLYRDLLSGPGDDAEGEGVELDGRTPGTEVTASAWTSDDTDALTLQSASGLSVGATGGGMGMGMGRGMGGGGGMRAGLSAPPTPELIAAIDALPPVVDEPEPILAEENTKLRQPFRFLAFLRPFLPQLLVGVLLVVIDAAAGLVGPAFTGESVNSVFLHREETILWVLSGVFFLVTMIDWADMWAETFWTGRTSERMLYSMRLRIFAHLQRLGMDFYDHEMTGRILTRMTSDVDTLSQLLQSGLLNALVYVVQFLGVVVILSTRNAHLILLVLTVVPPLAIATVWFRIQSTRAYDRQRDRISAVNADLQENMSGVRVTQAFRRETHNKGNFVGLTAGYRDAGLRSLKVSSIYFTFAAFLGNIAILIVLGVGNQEIHSGTLTIGALTAFLLYLTLLFAPVQQLSQVFDTYQQASAGLRKISGVLNTPIDTPQAEHPIEAGRLTGRVRFSGVRFRYSATVTDALRGVDLEIAPGRDRRAGRRDRGGQVDRHEADRPLLRPDRRVHHRRRPRARRPRPRRVPAPARIRPPGAVPLPGHDPRQHRLWVSGGDRRRGGVGGAGGRGPRLHRLGRRISETGLRAGTLALDRPAPAAVPGPGPAGRPGNPPLGRGDLEPRPRDRGQGQPRHGGGLERAHDGADRAPAADRQARRSHPRHGRRTGRGRGDPRRAGGGRPVLRHDVAGLRPAARGGLSPDAGRWRAGRARGRGGARTPRPTPRRSRPR